MAMEHVPFQKEKKTLRPPLVRDFQSAMFDDTGKSFPIIPLKDILGDIFNRNNP